MLADLTNASGDLKRIDTVDLLVSLTQLWEQDPRVPEYLNGLRDGQKNSNRAGLPFSDNLLAAVASSLLLKANSFPKGRPKWDGKILEDQTLKAWDDYFLPLHKALEREARLATVRSDTFGSAHSAILIHSITSSATAVRAGSQGEGAPASFMEKFDGHIGALSAAATKSTVVMEALSTAATIQYEKILAAMAQLKTLSIAAAATTGGGNRDSATGRLTPDELTKSNLRINQLMSAIKGKWVPGGFCSTHSYGVGDFHSSKICNNKTREGETGNHNNNATCDNTSGPGRNRNKYWDNFLLLRGGTDDSLNLDCAVTANPIFLTSSGCRPTLPPNITPSDTAIADIGASGIYLTLKASCANINPAALQVVAGTVGGPPHRSAASYDVNLKIPVTKGHLMPNLQHNLMGIGPLCGHGCHVLFEKYLLLSFTKDDTIILHGWREPSGAKLWQFSLLPKYHPSVPPEWSSGPTAINAHDLPSVGSLVRYLHAATGFSVKSTCLTAIKAVNYSSWPGLTYANA